MRIGYDHLSYQKNNLLDVQFTKGTGIIVNDYAKPNHSEISFVNDPTWGQHARGKNYLTFNGTTQYGELANADSGDLGFTSGDYSLFGWIYPVDSGASMMVMARYELDVGGWELYLYDITTPNGTLSLRHNHSLLAPTRTGCFSRGWEENHWYHFAITRSGLYPKIYQNGVELEVTYDAGGLQDPEATTQDLVIGCRYTKNSDYYEGNLARLGISNVALSSAQVKAMFEKERGLFGV